MPDAQQIDLETAVRATGAPVTHQPVPPLILPWCALVPSPLNPRTNMDPIKLAELADAIAIAGIEQALEARINPALKGKHAHTADTKLQPHEIVFGARRWNAVRLLVEAGRVTPQFPMPVVVRPCSDTELIIRAGIENLQREDMHPLDEARLFDNLRKHLPKDQRKPGARVELAVAKLLGVDERQVWRRLQLLRCAEPVQEALRDGKITLGQAAALSVGEAPAQAKILKKVTESNKEPDREWRLDVDEIRNEVAGKRIPASCALFDPKTFDGEVAQDPEDPTIGYFVDVKRFKQLQQAAIDAKLTELRATWKWVDVVKSHNKRWDYSDAPNGAPNAGATVFVSADLQTVEIDEGKLRPGTRAEPAPRSSGNAKGPKQPPRFLTEAQRNAVKTAKTIALRRSLVDLDGHHPALALTVLGMIGAAEIRIRDEGAGTGQEDVIYDDAVQAATEAAMKPLGDLVGKYKLAGGRKVRAYFDRLDDAPAATVFAALLELKGAQLLAILAALTAQRVATWPSWGNQHCNDIGDSPLIVELADALPAARKHLAAAWKPDKEFFAAYPTARLMALCQATDIVPATKLAGSKKSELVADIAKAKGIWPIDAFPELVFADAATIKAAIAGKKKHPPARKAKPLDGLSKAEQQRGRPAGVE